MDLETRPPDPAESEWLANQRKWTRGWRSVVFPGVFLVYLAQVGAGVSQYSRGVGAVVGYVVLGVFCILYLRTLPESWNAASRRFWPFYGCLVVLSALELPFARADAFVMCVFIVVVTVARLGGRAVPIVVTLGLIAAFLPLAIPSWHDNLGSAVSNGTAITIPTVGLAMFGFFNLMRGNRALAEARAELARLAAENERSRIARDLHDLLGHSLTTITVKAGLARRLGATDPVRALQEIAEVEALARRSLADVRAAVANYREVTLAGELATGRELLRAAGITADLPGAVDVVDPVHQELFGWVLREGLTNVVRHAHANICVVRLSCASVEIVDDGVGGSPSSGSGLVGLSERVAAAGGVLVAGPNIPNGWRLCVELGPRAAALAK
ncbi:MAG: histidine kinase [Acidimicrobiales bacterium]|jgi:two-component system sensor histidine kinase DesK